MKKKFLILFVLILLFVAANFFEKEVKDFFYSISQKSQIALASMSESVFGFFEVFFKAQGLEGENQILRTEIQGLKAQIIGLKNIEEENTFLRDAFGLEPTEEFELLLAEVVTKNMADDFIMINKGSEDGLEEGMIVITAEKALVGKITAVYHGFSRVSLVTNKEIGFAVDIQDRNCMAKTKGIGNAAFILDFIPRETEIFPGDCASTIGQETGLPKGLLVGEITGIRRSDLSAYQQADLRPAFEIQEIERVFVVLNY